MEGWIRYYPSRGRVNQGAGEAHLSEIEAARLRRLAAITRAVLPSLILSAVVAAMILSGVSRSRARAQANRGRLGQAGDILRAFGEQAAGFLASRQAADGSWAGPASTLRILLNLRGTEHERAPFYRAGLGFARAHERRVQAWMRGERGAGDAGDVEPTLETLALAWLLLGGEAAPPAEMRILLRKQETPRGLYRDELVRPGGPASAPRVRLTDNILLLGVLPAVGEDATALRASLRSRMAETGPLSPSARIALGHLASVATGSGGRPAPSPRATVLAPVDPALPEPVSGLDTSTLAAYVEVRGEECLLAADPCNEINLGMAALATRRQADGSWAAAPFGAEIPGAEATERSSEETTSLALKAIAVYRRIIAGRVDGTLGGSAPGGAPRQR